MAARKARGEAKSGTERPVTDRLVDEALEDTFPASDPPFFVGGVAEPDTAKRDDPTEKEDQRAARGDRH
jgi:hypothetical protein